MEVSVAHLDVVLDVWLCFYLKKKRIANMLSEVRMCLKLNTKIMTLK